MMVQGASWISGTNVKSIKLRRIPQNKGFPDIEFLQEFYPG